MIRHKSVTLRSFLISILKPSTTVLHVSILLSLLFINYVCMAPIIGSRTKSSSSLSSSSASFLSTPSSALIKSSSRTSSLTSSNQLNFWQYELSPRAQKVTTFHRVVVDVVTGAVFVSGTDGLFKFNSLLKRLDFISTASTMSIDCTEPESDRSDCGSRFGSLGEDDVLGIVGRNLLHCSTVMGERKNWCSVFQTTGGLEKSWKLGDGVNDNFTARWDSGGAGRAFVGTDALVNSGKIQREVFSLLVDSTNKTENVPTLYTFDSGRSLNANPITISINRVVIPSLAEPSAPSSSLSQLRAPLVGSEGSGLRMEHRGTLHFNKLSLTSRYKARSVFAFENNRFVYFVTVQRDSLDFNDNYDTRIVRVCLDESASSTSSPMSSSTSSSSPLADSYVELTLSCRKRTSVSFFYNIATAGYRGLVGPAMGKRFGLSGDKQREALYLAMGRSNRGESEANPLFGSGICVFLLSDIQQAFVRAQKDCYQGNGLTLPWIGNSARQCIEDRDVTASIDDNFCGRSLNSGISSRYPLATDTNFTADNHHVMSLAVVIQHNATVAVMGTSAGHLIKAQLDVASSLVYLDLDIGSGLQVVPLVARDMAFDLPREHLYVLTGPRITRVPIGSCSVYEDCGSCVMSHDPLECGWCDDHCSTQQLCPATARWSDRYCPPFIHSCSPVSGPVQGGTLLTLIGFNFGGISRSGSTDVSVSVKVALVDCKIEHRNATYIECRTGPSARGPIDREVKVTVFDKSRSVADYDIEGSVSSGRMTFAYKVPSVTSLLPKFGPISGGTLLTVRGQNLDIGSSTQITVVSRACSLISVSSTQIVCRTEPFELRWPTTRMSTVNVEYNNTASLDFVTKTPRDHYVTTPNRSHFLTELEVETVTFSNKFTAVNKSTEYFPDSAIQDSQQNLGSSYQDVKQLFITGNVTQYIQQTVTPAIIPQSQGITTNVSHGETYGVMKGLTPVASNDKTKLKPMEVNVTSARFPDVKDNVTVDLDRVMENHMGSTQSIETFSFRLPATTLIIHRSTKKLTSASDDRLPTIRNRIIDATESSTEVHISSSISAGRVRQPVINLSDGVRKLGTGVTFSVTPEILRPTSVTRQRRRNDAKQNRSRRAVAVSTITQITKRQTTKTTAASAIAKARTTSLKTPAPIIINNAQMTSRQSSSNTSTPTTPAVTTTTTTSVTAPGQDFKRTGSVEVPIPVTRRRTTEIMKRYVKSTRNRPNDSTLSRKTPIAAAWVLEEDTPLSTTSKVLNTTFDAVRSTTLPTSLKYLHITSSGGQSDTATPAVLKSRDADMRSRDATSRSGSVIVAIDAAVLTGQIFTYLEDPQITDIRRRTSFVSGGLSSTVLGHNLNVVQQSFMYVSFMSNQSENDSFNERCISNANGTSMTCLTPNITSSDANVTTTRPQKAWLHFIMDGVDELLSFNVTHPELSEIVYVVDPELKPFEQNVRLFYDDENYLEIQGRHLDLAARADDYHVTLGSTKCTVEHLSSSILMCRPDRPELVIGTGEALRNVKVCVGRLAFNIGYLKFTERTSDWVISWAAAPIMGLVCLLGLIGLLWMRKSCNRLRKWRTRDDVSYVKVMENSQRGTVAVHHPVNILNNPWLNWQATSEDQSSNILYLQSEPILSSESWQLVYDSDIVIPRDQLVLLDVIGQGNFGCVYRGLLLADDKFDRQVAVKTLKSLSDGLSSISRPGTNRAALTLEARKFVDEALRMREFDHQHILQLIGVSFDKDEMPLVVLPYLKHGDLLSYVRNERNSPTVKELMEFCIEIAEGMSYLSNLKFVHRDLAARNCMLDDEMHIKVADFGLSRDIYERDYYSCDNRKMKLPVKWMALESLEKGIYTSKTDVWSYGIVMWELMTRGINPYPEVDNWDIIKFLRCGRRMSQPPYCPDALYDAMLLCWHFDAKSRPAFEDLAKAIATIITTMEQHPSNEDSNRRLTPLPPYTNAMDHQTPSTSYLTPRTMETNESSPGLVSPQCVQVEQYKNCFEPLLSATDARETIQSSTETVCLKLTSLTCSDPMSANCITTAPRATDVFTDASNERAYITPGRGSRTTMV